MAKVTRPQGYGAILKKVSGISGVDPNADPNAPQAARAPIGYGVFAQGLAGALQQDAADPFFGGSAKYQLENLADEERASVATTTDKDRKAAVYAELFKHIDPKDARGLSHINDEYGVFNPVTVMADAAIDRDGSIATNNKTTMEGFNQGRQAGIMPTTAQAQTELGNSITGEAATGYSVIPVTNDEQAKLTTANAAMIKAEADRTDANNPLKYNRKSGGSSGGSEGGSFSYITPMMIDGQMVPVTRRGKGAPPQDKPNAGPTNSPAQTQRLQAAQAGGAKFLGHNSHGDPVVDAPGRGKVAIDRNGRPYQ